jgi:calcineurin-like phosphoesterase family protein
VGQIFIWSDVHFHHSGIIKYCNRPFKDVAEMDAAIESRWNAVVGPTDTIWFLGDFGFSHSKMEPLKDVFLRLNGHKNLIVGNHDEKNRETLKLGWENVFISTHPNQPIRLQHIHHLKGGDLVPGSAILCHYPLESWYGAHKGILMLHGHSHGSLRRQVPHRFDVGFDVFPAGPVPFAQFVTWAKAQKFRPTDHHGDL